MRILILTPSAFPKLTGNAVTTERWRRSLTDKGLDVRVLSAEACDIAELEENLLSFAPDVIHVYHAFKAGSLFLRHFERNGHTLPLVLSPGGTDINLDLRNPDRSESILQILEMADVIVGQSSPILQHIRERIPSTANRLVAIPKACIWFGNEPFDLRTQTNCGADAVLFFMPAGIRPVKGNVECLHAMETVHGLRPQTRFAAAGPIIDIQYARTFEQEIRRLSAFASYLGSIHPAKIRAAYNSADIVLNFSFSEGLSNSMIEAVAAGRPILASNIPGNQHPLLFEDGKLRAGCFFDPLNPKDFVNKAVRLIDDEQIRGSLAAAARQIAPKLASPDLEADGLIAAYKLALNKRS
jgi:glycosyltransferase involved in cell wall biosynthesis